MAESIMSLDEFFAEAKRLKLTAADLVPKLVMRPEFADCLSDDFKEAKAIILAMPEQDLRALAIAQYIQLRTHEKYGNTMQNLNAAFRAEQAAAGVPGATVREFTNELGNRIRITIEGPSSISENVLTPMEAAKLRGALDAHGVPTVDGEVSVQNHQGVDASGFGEGVDG